MTGRKGEISPGPHLNTGDCVTSGLTGLMFMFMLVLFIRSVIPCSALCKFSTGGEFNKAPVTDDGVGVGGTHPGGGDSVVMVIDPCDIIADLSPGFGIWIICGPIEIFILLLY